tara:strand:- start:70 stop:462 length:393 start_codon:yes stop_codon:yes gene_type:complete
MNTKLFEKSLIGISFEALIDLSKSNSNKKKIFNGYLYALYNKEDNSIEIRYSESIQNLKNKYLNNKFSIKNIKRGKKKEIRYLFETLSEIGHVINKYTNKIKFTRSLVEDLTGLGWLLLNPEDLPFGKQI